MPILIGILGFLCLISWVVFFMALAEDEVKNRKEFLIGILPYGMIILFLYKTYRGLPKK